MTRHKREQQREQRGGWGEAVQEIVSGMSDWREQHPQATLAEIERALDERWARLRARMVEDLAQRSRLADLTRLPEAERPRCPECQGRLQARGLETRELTSYHDRTLRLERSYAECSACGTGLFPPG